MLPKLHWPTLKWPLIIALMALAMAIGPSRALAGPAPSQVIASFSSSTGTPLDFFNSSGLFQTGSTSGTPVSIPVTFQFLVANSSGYGTSPISALLTITSSISGAGTSAGPVTVQPMSTTTFDFTTTMANGSNCECLFTATSSSSAVYGLTGSNSGTLGGSSSSSSIVSYSSMYFNNTSYNDTYYNVSLGQLTEPLKLGGNGVLGSFSSSGQGTFDAAPVPEASTLVSFGLLFLSGAVFVFCKMRRVDKKPEA